jgi:hypothetical protein
LGEIELAGGTMIDWQPIETAPKDGFEVLVCDVYIEAITVAVWNSQLKRWGTDWDSVAQEPGLAPVWTHWAPINLPEESDAKP